jgi:hypothetical protein
MPCSPAGKLRTGLSDPGRLPNLRLIRDPSPVGRRGRKFASACRGVPAGSALSLHERAPGTFWLRQERQCLQRPRQLSRPKPVARLGRKFAAGCCRLTSGQGFAPRKLRQCPEKLAGAAPPRDSPCLFRPFRASSGFSAESAPQPGAGANFLMHFIVYGQSPLPSRKFSPELAGAGQFMTPQAFTDRSPWPARAKRGDTVQDMPARAQDRSLSAHSRFRTRSRPADSRRMARSRAARFRLRTRS